MLQHIGSFWRRMLKSERPASDSAVGTQVDRRVWDRQPGQAETTVHLANSSDPTRHPAHVRDVSPGGINVVVGKEFEPGQLLSIELPGGGRPTNLAVLMCVVHVTPAGEGQWAVGGTFSRELTEDDLEAFGAGKKRSAAPDKRSWERFACTLKAMYSVVTAPEPAMFDATVLNISASGVGLSVDRPTEAGTLLSVDLMNPSGHVIRTILACVVHAGLPQDGRWALGCNFIRQLREDDLRALT